jgi:putative transposase
MPWKDSSVMDEKMKFIVKILEGESMVQACSDFGISRKTGYKIWNRYQNGGAKELSDRTRRPVRYGNQLPIQIESTIVRLKKEKPNWGAPKIRELVSRKYPDLKLPSKSTVHAVLDRHGLVKRRNTRRNKFMGTGLGEFTNPNDLWCADYKGEFMLGDQRYCYPLTITDQVSRYVIAIEALETTKEVFAIKTFERVFEEYGLPKAMRTDNGVPFASANSLFGLSKLSVWWLRLGIRIERIEPGHPEQNGRHERMHLTLKKETTRPAEMNILQQQGRFDAFQNEFNNERPHEALAMKVPAEIYRASEKKYEGLSHPHYPFHDRTILVTACGRICISKQKINLSTVFAGQAIGVKEVSDGISLVSFMDYDLGYIDESCNNFAPLDNPFVPPKVLPMSSV